MIGFVFRSSSKLITTYSFPFSRRTLQTSNFMMATFKKLQVIKLSSDFNEATTVNEVPLIPTTTGKIRIKNYYAGVNASDINITAGRYFTDGKVPFDVGFEGCGLIDEVAPGVEGFKVGQPVLYFGTSGYSEYIYAKPEEIIPIPELKPEFLATLVTGKSPICYVKDTLTTEAQQVLLLPLV